MGKRFRELLAEDKVVRVFAAGRVIHPVIFDLFGLAGEYDGFWLDQEHGGLTYEQISDLCGVSVSTVYRRFEGGLSLLREKLGVKQEK